MSLVGRVILETLFEVRVRACLVPRNASTKTPSLHPHMAWDKLTNPKLARITERGTVVLLLPPLASEDV